MTRTRAARANSIDQYRNVAGGSRDESGTAIAELSILLVVMLLLAVGVFEFGRGFHTYASVVQAAREGARAAMDGTKTDAEIESIATTSASPVSISVTVSHQGARTTVTASSPFTSGIPLISTTWGGGPLIMTRAFTSE